MSAALPPDRPVIGAYRVGREQEIALRVSTILAVEVVLLARRKLVQLALEEMSFSIGRGRMHHAIADQLEDVARRIRSWPPIPVVDAMEVAA